MNDWIPFVITAQPWAAKWKKGLALVFVYVQFLAFVALIVAVAKAVWGAW